METYILKTKEMNNIIEQSYYKYKKPTKKSGTSTEEEKQKASRSRATSRIKEIVNCNDFEYFFTLTIASDLKFEHEKAMQFLVKSINYYKKLAYIKGYDFKFVYIFELTKNNGIHLHGFFSGFFDLYINKYNHLSSLYFDNIGFQNFIKASEVNKFYLIKYIRKSPIYLKHIYHTSRNLNKPKITIFHDRYKLYLNIPFTFQNKYAKMITYEK